MSQNFKKDRDDEIDLGKFLRNLLLEWKLIVISVFICLSLCVFFLLNYSPLYKIHSKVLVIDNNTDAGKLASIGGRELNDLGDLLGVKSNVDNEVVILDASSLLTKVVRENNFFIQVFQDDFINKTELYQHSPFEITFVHLKESFENIEIELKTNNDNTITLLSDDETFPHHQQFGDTLHCSI
ncbi:MAG: hypothetical protein RL311_938, partial [Bacteroidota bacterium]